MPMPALFTERFVKWISAEGPGRLFTVVEAREAVNDGLPLEDQVTIERAGQTLSRLSRKDAGVIRKGQGLYQWMPPRSTRSAKPAERKRPGPRVRDGVLDAPSLAIAGAGAFVAAEEEPPPVESPEPAPDVEAPAAPTKPATVAASGYVMKPGDPMILTYLAAVGPSTFLAQHDENGKVYRVTEVRGDE